LFPQGCHSTRSCSIRSGKVMLTRDVDRHLAKIRCISRVR
jgi:hypothetical protein